MSTHHRPTFHQHVLVDTTPMPASIPPVKEIGSTSAPLLSAAYFIGARCRPFNDDYMQCKTDAYGRGEFECMKEGRRVTRCASSVLEDINTNCLQEFRQHWSCLENSNHQLWQCRRPERTLNKCVFEKLGLKKEIPDTPAAETPVHLRQSQIYASSPQYDPDDPQATAPPRLFRGWVQRMENNKREYAQSPEAAAKRKQTQEQKAKWDAESGEKRGQKA